MKQLHLVTQSTALAIALGLFSTAASAQSTDAIYIGQTIQSGASSIVGAINNIAAFLASRMDADLKGNTPNAAQYLEINPLGTQLNAAQASAVTDLTLPSISGTLGPNTNPGITAALASNLAGDSLPPPKAINGGQIQACGNNMFNFESLMGYSSYANQNLACNPGTPQDVSSYASNYIQYAGNMGSPPSMFSINQMVSNGTLSADQALTLQQSSEWTDFELGRRNIISLESAGLSNLYYLYNQRVAADGKGNSPESLANQIANWRAGNKDWYTSMNAALSTVLLRENLFIMAEIQRDLHEMRKENQRMLATQSLMLLQNTQIGKALLLQRLAAVNQKIQLITKPASSTGTP